MTLIPSPAEKSVFKAMYATLVSQERTVQAINGGWTVISLATDVLHGADHCVTYSRSQRRHEAASTVDNGETTTTRVMFTLAKRNR